uniref:3 beta-hydroxysteroid dehydrogenase/Delta 5-->4-isomerase-like n=1 Tax=Salarias fasciatus TaxID=181472 RepID=A0A672GW28_SALFA
MSLRGDVCVVTGAAGFLGKRLVRLLLEEERPAEIRLLDKHVQPEVLDGLEDCRGDSRLTVLEGDVRDGDFLRTACRGATVVFHTASIIDVRDSVEYSEMYSVNVRGTQLLLEACVSENVSSFIYTSTIEVMGPNPAGDAVTNGTEDTAYKSSLKFNYSKTKKEAEDRTLAAHGEALPGGGRLATCVLRPMYIFGEGCRFLLGHMADGVRNRDVLFRMSRPEALVNPVYVGNVAAAHLQAARALQDPRRRERAGGQFYFVSDDTPPVSYSDFNHAVLAPLGFGIQDRSTWRILNVESSLIKQTGSCFRHLRGKLSSGFYYSGQGPHLQGKNTKRKQLSHNDCCYLAFMLTDLFKLLINYKTQP